MTAVLLEDTQCPVWVESTFTCPCNPPVRAQPLPQFLTHVSLGFQWLALLLQKNPVRAWANDACAKNRDYSFWEAGFWETLEISSKIQFWKQRRLLTALQTIDLYNGPYYIIKKEQKVGSIILTCTPMASFASSDAINCSLCLGCRVLELSSMCLCVVPCHLMGAHCRICGPGCWVESFASRFLCPQVRELPAQSL